MPLLRTVAFSCLIICVLVSHTVAAINPNGTTKPLGGKESGNVKQGFSKTSYITICYKVILAERVSALHYPIRDPGGVDAGMICRNKKEADEKAVGYGPSNEGELAFG